MGKFILDVDKFSENMPSTSHTVVECVDQSTASAEM